MKKKYFFGFLLLMVFDSLAQLCFKYTAINALPLEPSLDWLMRVFTHPWVYGALLGYVGAFFSWMTLLKRISVGPAFAASHLEVVSTLFLSHFLFGEIITGTKFFGAILILCGIACLAFAEDKLNQFHSSSAN